LELLPFSAYSATVPAATSRQTIPFPCLFIQNHVCFDFGRYVVEAGGRASQYSPVQKRETTAAQRELGGIISLLDEPEQELKVYALKKLDSLVNQFWTEIADSVGKM